MRSRRGHIVTKEEAYVCANLWLPAEEIPRLILGAPLVDLRPCEVEVAVDSWVTTRTGEKARLLESLAATRDASNLGHGFRRRSLAARQ